MKNCQLLKIFENIEYLAKLFFSTPTIVEQLKIKKINTFTPAPICICFTQRRRTNLRRASSGGTPPDGSLARATGGTRRPMAQSSARHRWYKPPDETVQCAPPVVRAGVNVLISTQAMRNRLSVTNKQFRTFVGMQLG